MPENRRRLRAREPVGKAARLKEYYLSFVSTLAVLYALLLAVLCLGEAVGVDKTVLRINRYFQVPRWTGSNVFPVLFFLLALYLAYHLWFKKKAALIVLVVFMVVKAVFSLIGGMNAQWSVISMVIAACFLTAWSAFKVNPDFRYARKALVVAIVAIPLLMIYGTIGLYLGRKEYQVATSGPALIKNAWLLVVGRSSIHFTGSELAFKYSLIGASLAVIAYLLFLMFRPHKAPGEFTWEDEETARKILEYHGHDSLSYFNTRKGKSYFFLEDECFLAYRVVGGMAVMSADPVGPEEMHPQLLSDFRDYCISKGWRIGGVAQNERTAAILKRLGVHVFMLGEEALVEVTDFTLEGRGVRKLRQSCNQMTKSGTSVEFMFNSSIPSHVRHTLQEISRTWRGDNPETGFSMGLGRLLSASDPDCLLALAYDGSSKPIGFLYLVPMYPHEGFSLDITRTMFGSPKSLTDFLIARTILFLQHEKYSYLSLHFLAFSQYYRPGSPHKASRLWKSVANLMDRRFPVVSSWAFDTKFSPGYVSRFLVYPSYLEFIRAGLTVIVAESALKLTRPLERRKREEAALGAAE
ncbi:MAG: bifunctional lysylphosphatidylglycerol flippase/synthetase MprF [Candidatus Geothermincolia bacterium]